MSELGIEEYRFASCDRIIFTVTTGNRISSTPPRFSRKLAIPGHWLSCAALTERDRLYPFPIPFGGFNTDIAPAVKMACCVYPVQFDTVTLFLVSWSSYDGARSASTVL